MSDDEDEFGDFEEAQIVEEKETVEQKEIVESYECPSVIQESLQSITANDEFWNLDSESENVNTEIDAHDVFDSFNVLSNASDFRLDVQCAGDIWSQLRIGEGVNALQFQWLTSKSCVQFVNSLSLHFAKNSNRVEYKVNDETPEEEQQYVSLQSLSVTQEWDLPKSTSDINLEELNGTSSLDYKVFEAGPNTNSQSVLDQELGALGLIDSDQNHVEKSVASPTANGVAHRSSEHKNIQQPRYLCVSELSQEAQSFYERLPDLSFMLQNQVIGER
ncbi:hypothetical protein M3Y98_00148700 [Aphelenchoides besseyi]|nr:hypothetical protein M3Y98_00148700 [Aphelenchoides besseyi]KAI6199779.1 hypothetical protein M3Y96_00663200 [Aphelenchoides besseyi]